MRDIIFVSHANPEDNEFARWLSLQLIKAGYPVWCDLIRLKGGEDFWKDIEKSIRDRAVKVVYVLSKTSNVKDGPLQELAVAKKVARVDGLHDFIIPTLIDDLPFKDINIELHRINVISFQNGWAKGLKTLLEKLAEDKVETNPDFTPETVTTWWREQFSANKGVIAQEEQLISSWYPIQSFPEFIYYHLLRDHPAAERRELPEPDFPYTKHLNGILSFASRNDFEGKRIGEQVVVDTFPYLTEDALEDRLPLYVMSGTQANNATIHLFDLAWRKAMLKQGLAEHEIANSASSFYFIENQIEKDKIAFTGINGKRAHRSIMGYKSIKLADGSKRKRHWHYAISAKPQRHPVLSFCIRGHVLFSDDGKTIWESDARLHKARMSQCRSWWNDDWRDRMLATMNWLKGDDDAIKLELSSDVALGVAGPPFTFTSPVTYLVPGTEEKHALSGESEDVEDEEEYFDDEEEDD